MKQLTSAVSVGIVDGQKLLDLDYSEDSRAEVDCNVIMTSDWKLVEIQATAEGDTFTESDLQEILELAKSGLKSLFAIQRQVLVLTVRNIINPL